MIDLRELIDRGEPIYVRNKTADFLPKGGTFILEINDGKKSRITITIPATKYPFLLSARAPTQLLAQSTELYTAISRGILELVDPEEARDEMKDPDARKAVEAAMRKFQPTRRINRPPPELVAASNKRNRPLIDQGTNDLPSTGNLPLRIAEVNETDVADQDVNPKITQLIMDLTSDPDLRDDKYLELIGMEGLTADDLGYILNHCQESTKLNKIVQWARKELAELVDNSDVDLEARTTKRRRRKKRS